MKQKNIAIINYNLNNLFSVKNAITQLGFNSNITYDHKEILQSDGVILPGVGSFSQAMKQIKNFGLDSVIREVINEGKLFFGICLGFQLLFDSSDENGCSKGLSVLKGEVKHLSTFGKIRKIPHVGWNKINMNINDYTNNEINLSKFNNKYFYFVHSHAVQVINQKRLLTSTKIEDSIICSSVYKKRLIATQFHPEKSGIDGLNLLKDFFSQES